MAAVATMVGVLGTDGGRDTENAPIGSPSSGAGEGPRSGSGGPAPSAARDIPDVLWLSPDGDDSDSGTRDAPWRTPQAALDSGAGVIRLHPGSYPPFVVGREGVVVAGDQDERPMVVGQIRILANDVRISQLDVSGATGPYEGAVLVDQASGVVIERSRIHDSTFGIHLRDASNTAISGNELDRNGSAIEIHGVVAGTTIAHNRIHHNDRAVDDSRGANGIVFFRATGPVTVADNELWSNLNPSPAPDTDAGGGAFEVYASTDVVIDGNRLWDNSILETGTEAGLPCRGLVFVRNVAWRGKHAARQEGLVLRCAEDGLVAHNVIDGFDRFAVDIAHLAGPFAGSVDGLRVVNNVLVNGRAYSIDTSLPPSVVIDYNLVDNAGSSAENGEFIAHVSGRGNTRSVDELRSWGFDRNGATGDPLFVDRQSRDYRLADGSPAVDAGMVIPGFTDGADRTPDIGPGMRA